MKVKLSIVCIFCLFILTEAFGQDRIITNAGDTILCKITRVSETHLHYKVIQDGLRTRIPLTSVSSYFQSSVKEANEIEVNTDPPSYELFGSVDPPRTRVALNAGWTYQFGGYENFPLSYTRQLRSLLHLGAEFHYFASPTVGLGIKFNRISTPTDHPGFGAIGRIEESIRMNFLALSFLSRQNYSDKTTLNFGVALGLLDYRDSGTIDADPFLEEGSTFGLNLDVGYDWWIDDSLAIGISLGVNLARLNSLIVNNVRIPGANFNLSRVDITTGIRF